MKRNDNAEEEKKRKKTHSTKWKGLALAANFSFIALSEKRHKNEENENNLVPCTTVHFRRFVWHFSNMVQFFAVQMQTARLLVRFAKLCFSWGSSERISFYLREHWSPFSIGISEYHSLSFARIWTPHLIETSWIFHLLGKQQRNRCINI